MSTDSGWAALVSAEQETAKVRAAINQRPDRTDLLSAALASTSPWQRGTALTFLRGFSDDTPQFLEQLIDLSLSLGWARECIDVLRAARGTLDPVRFKDAVIGHLATGDADDYVRLAQLAAEVEQWPTLRAIVERAATSSDPEILEVAQEYTDSHGIVLGAAPE